MGQSLRYRQVELHVPYKAWKANTNLQTNPNELHMATYIWVRLEIPYPHWEVCLGGMLRRYASGFASGVCFGVCFACTSSHGTYFISKRLPKIFPTFCISLCVSLQGCEVSYSRVQNVPGSGSWRFEVWNGCDSGMIRVWFAEHYSAHRIRSRQELQRPVSTRSWLMQTVSAATMKLQRPVSTEAVFNLLGCIGQPDCGDGGRDGAKGA